MSIGILSGTLASRERIEVIFEAYYQAPQENSLNSYLTERLGISSFVTSSSGQTAKQRIMTLDNFQREGDARWSTHEIIGKDKKPILEYIGPGLETVSFSVLMLASLGINPQQELQKLRQLRDNGVICDFTIGTSAVSTNQWVINKLSESHKYFDDRGSLIGAAVTVNLTEYTKLPKES